MWKKLNLKDQAEIVVLNPPESFEGELRMLDGVRVRRTLTGVRRVTFALAFVTRQRELLSLAPALGELAEGDAVLWFAYPKGTSKRYETDISRDTGWQAVSAEKLEGVRMVAIDEDWSAKRVRRAEFIKRADS